MSPLQYADNQPQQDIGLHEVHPHPRFGLKDIAEDFVSTTGTVEVIFHTDNNGHWPLANVLARHLFGVSTLDFVSSPFN